MTPALRAFMTCEGELTPALRALLILRGGIDARVAGVCMDMYILKDECIININYECKDV